MQFRPAPLPLVRGEWSAQRPSWSDRECPLVTAGDRCLWHAGGTAGQNDGFPAGGDGSPLAGRVRPPRVTTVSLASCEAARQPVAGRITSVEPPDQLPSWAPATTTPGSHNRSAGGISPPSPRLSSAVQESLMTSLALRAKTRQINTCNPPLYHCGHGLSIR